MPSTSQAARHCCCLAVHHHPHSMHTCSALASISSASMTGSSAPVAPCLLCDLSRMSWWCPDKVLQEVVCSRKASTVSTAMRCNKSVDLLETRVGSCAVPGFPNSQVLLPEKHLFFLFLTLNSCKGLYLNNGPRVTDQMCHNISACPTAPIVTAARTITPPPE